MQEPIIITNRGEVKRKPVMRRNLPYQGIARRALNSKIEYDREIDISAVITKSSNNDI